MPICKTPLAQKMHDLADNGHENADELRELANKFEEATEKFYAIEQQISAKEFLGHYARARKCWCRITGESLV